MKRVTFEKGKQKEFFQLVKKKLNLLSLRSIKQFGIETNYSTIKNYYQEKRLMPEQLFLDLCHLAKINNKEISTNYKEENWGQIKGGKKGIITLRKKYKDKLIIWAKKGGETRAKRLI